MEWTPKFAYAVGLITTDGSLSIDGRHKQLRIRFHSGSLKHLLWLKQQIYKLYHIEGGFIYKNTNGRVSVLTYCKGDSIKLLQLMYYNGVELYLNRKFKLIQVIKGEW